MKKYKIDLTKNISNPPERDEDETPSIEELLEGKPPGQKVEMLRELSRRAKIMAKREDLKNEEGGEQVIEALKRISVIANEWADDIKKYEMN